MIAVCIEEFALIVRAQQTLVRVLAVNIDQIFADLAQLRQGHSRAVHVGATAALGVDDPAQHQLVLGVQVVFGQPAYERFRGLEYCADLGSGGTFSQHSGVGTLAQGERQCINQDGFSGASFTRENSKACIKGDVGFSHDDKVANM